MDSSRKVKSTRPAMEGWTIWQQGLDHRRSFHWLRRTLVDQVIHLKLASDDGTHVTGRQDRDDVYGSWRGSPAGPLSSLLKLTFVLGEILRRVMRVAHQYLHIGHPSNCGSNGCAGENRVSAVAEPRLYERTHGVAVDPCEYRLWSYEVRLCI